MTCVVHMGSFGGRSPEKKAADLLRTMFTFCAARWVFRQNLLITCKYSRCALVVCHEFPGRGPLELTSKHAAHPRQQSRGSLGRMFLTR